MNQRTIEWCNRIDTYSAQFQTDFGHLSHELLNWKPAPNVWSIGQNLDHLITINYTYKPIFAALQSGSLKLSWMSKISFFPSLFGKMILGSVQPDRKRKSKTFPIWEPSQSNVPPEIWDHFDACQEWLKDQLNELEAQVDKGAVIHSPANKNIVYRLETAFEIIVSHEGRHLEQSREVLQLLQTT